MHSYSYVVCCNVGIKKSTASPMHSPMRVDTSVLYIVVRPSHRQRSPIIAWPVVTTMSPINEPGKIEYVLFFVVVVVKSFLDNVFRITMLKKEWSPDMSMTSFFLSIELVELLLCLKYFDAKGKSKQLFLDLYWNQRKYWSWLLSYFYVSDDTTLPPTPTHT